MSNLNKVFLMGRLTRDPEVRYTTKGAPVGVFGMATNREWRTENGEKKEEVCYINITVWGKGALFAEKHLKKGDLVFVDGHLKLESWTNKQGEKKSSLKVEAEKLSGIIYGKAREAISEAAQAHPDDSGDQGEPHDPPPDDDPKF